MKHPVTGMAKHLDDLDQKTRSQMAERLYRAYRAALAAVRSCSPFIYRHAARVVRWYLQVMLHLRHNLSRPEAVFYITR